MRWADAAPNLLIGLREGLEAGLVVSILLAALRQTNAGLADGKGRRISTTPVWLGVLGAVMVSASFAAVLTYSTDALSSRARQAVGGVLSVLAVGLVTVMVFWMRRTARLLSTRLRGEVARAVTLGAGALTITAFLAVAREGLETTLFLWTAVKASAETTAPLLGGALGLAGGVVVCGLLYRQAVRLNLGTFFHRTAIALILIAAGVLSYGMRDLQEAGWLPGQRWVAFDLSSRIDPQSWWVTIITGVTELSPTMTVLQVVTWTAYLTVTVTTFRAAGPPPVPARADAAPVPGAGRWERLVARRGWPVAGAMVVLPPVLAGAVIAVLPAAPGDQTTVTVTADSCAPEWSSGRTGTQTFMVSNKTRVAGEITLVDSSGAIVAEIETIGPATTATMSASLASGSYSFVCLMSGASRRGQPVEVRGEDRPTTLAVKRVTLDELTTANASYQRYAAAQVTALAADVATLRAALAGDDLARARTAWLAAQLDWERVGASYNSFGAIGEAVDGLPDGRPLGVRDPDFVGLHRIEYGLHHGQSAAELVPIVDQLALDVASAGKNLTSEDEAGDPTALPLRGHEILEDALRDHLSGRDDQGAAMAYALTWADAQATRAVLDQIMTLIDARDPGLGATLAGQLDTLEAALTATRAGDQWQPASAVPLAARQRVDAALGVLLESLASVPTLLELPPDH